jgi:hypothetical protein
VIADVLETVFPRAHFRTSFLGDAGFILGDKAVAKATPKRIVGVLSETVTLRLGFCLAFRDLVQLLKVRYKHFAVIEEGAAELA